MPARKGRRDLTADDARAEARIQGLREAAAHATTVLERTGAGPGATDAAAHAAPEQKRRGFRWPFGRKPDPEAERKAQILAVLEAAVEGRPSAVDRARSQETQPQPQHDILRAAG
jgi:hypothetical protein